MSDRLVGAFLVLWIVAMAMLESWLLGVDAGLEGLVP